MFLTTSYYLHVLYSLFAIFENLHYAADQVYFYESNSKVFIFFKLIFFLKIFKKASCYSTSKNNRPDENLKYFFLILLGDPKRGKMVFDYVEEKLNSF